MDAKSEGLSVSGSPHPRPFLHNALWPGLVGKSGDAEPCISLDMMLELTSSAVVDGARFDGVDLMLSSPHVDADASDVALKGLSDKVAAHGLVVGSLVAPVWKATGGGSAIGSDEERRRFLEQVKNACRIGRRLRELGIRRYGVIRIDSAASPEEWAQAPVENTRRLAESFRRACDIAEDYGEKLAAEGEICWGGMHSWRHMVHLLELVDRPDTIGFQADMAHTLLFILGHNAPEHRLLPEDFDWAQDAEFDRALRIVTDALRPWTTDLHIAQNDGTVKGSGSHDKTGRHCLPLEPNGKLDIVKHAGYWMRERDGTPVHRFEHICWDGCMFPNSVMMDPGTWESILANMIAVRDAHGWIEDRTKGNAA
jgi:sugar phosphate isomerase/epimerase